MGFLKKIKKRLKPLIGIALKTAPIWSSFIPGGSIVGQAIAKTQKFVGGSGAGKFGAGFGVLRQGLQAAKTFRNRRRMSPPEGHFTPRGLSMRSRFIRTRRRMHGPMRFRYARSHFAARRRLPAYRFARATRF